ncbi:MAG TPA: putative nucleotide-diphospho-sugar transferase [Candidatus Deferrimicrobiaceae bacterium]|nr:putative nucleotide-diphospho-sugar transferase [Candidatus Deferrimicrobiaceae bacterium]
MPEVCLQNNLPFVIVSYFTREYRAPALRLIDSCRKTGLDFYVVDVESRRSWLENVRRRPAFLFSIFPTTARDLVWIDADGMVRSFPELFGGARAAGYDLAAHRNSKGRYRVGTMWFANTEAGRAFVSRWADAVARMRGKTEQEALNALLLRPSRGVKVLDLPATYCSIFDKAVDKAAGPAVIEHFQASRKLRRLVR